MGIQLDHLDLVQQALDGRQEALRQLAEVAYNPLRSYVLRITFREEITDDIVQETMLEMFRIFQQLKEADRFWPWLYKIALNKVRQYSVKQNRHRELLKQHAEQICGSENTDGLAAAINREFQQAIMEALSHLSERQKAVLSMRCYENMSYSQIAEVMDVSELGCRLLLTRARKTLQSKLYRLGYGRKSLLLALALLGKLTASSEAAAAEISLSPQVLSVGAVAGGISLLTSNAVLITAAAVGLSAGGLAVKQAVDAPPMATEDTPFTQVWTEEALTASVRQKECFYFFPLGRHGPVMTRLVAQDGGHFVLQNDEGNYSYDAGALTATIHNHHYWNPDLSVMMLPTDSEVLETFLARMEGRPANVRHVNSDSLNLFIMTNTNQSPQFFGAANYNALMEERFQYNWPAGSGIIDERDAFHRQGYCGWRVEGAVHGKTVTGGGVLPFTYSEAMRRSGRLVVNIGDDVTMIDAPSGAAILDQAQTAVRRYPSGTFLCGLNRPWSGLHTIDTVRRDAAAFGIVFQTQMEADRRRARVRLQPSGGCIEYMIDMHKDWIEHIVLVDNDGARVGQLSFTYVADTPANLHEAGAADASGHAAGSDSLSMHWLSMLLKDKLAP